jgi:hypothetical protein
VWDALQPLADKGGVDADASARLDELAVRYQRLLADAAAIDIDVREAAVKATRRRGAAEALEQARQGAVEDRALRDVGGRDLLKVLGRRLAGKIRRRPGARL